MSWKMKAKWTIRNMAAHYSLLFWATRIIKLNVAEKFNAMKAYRWLAQQIQAVTQQSELDGIWDCQAKLPKAALRELKIWTKEALQNAPASIAEQPVEHTIFVDASKYKWGAVCWDHRTNEIAIIAKRWDSATQKRGMEHSTKAEPLAVTRAVRTYMEGKDKITAIRVFTDSITARAAHKKGYAADYMINSAVRTLKRELPNVVLHLFHIKGEQNPADAPSRGKRIRTWNTGELAELANGCGAEVAQARDKVNNYSTQITR